MGFKRILGAVIFAGSVAYATKNPEWQENGKSHEIAARLAQPRIAKLALNPGTATLCQENPDRIVNNTCTDTNQQLITIATSNGFTCYSGRYRDGEISGTCDLEGDPCDISEITTTKLGILAWGEDVFKHSCPQIPKS